MQAPKPTGLELTRNNVNGGSLEKFYLTYVFEAVQIQYKGMLLVPNQKGLQCSKLSSLHYKTKRK